MSKLTKSIIRCPKMYEEKVISSRPDRELFKKLVTPGDYTVVPFEDSRCKIALTDVSCAKGEEPCQIEAKSHIFSSKFNGNVLIGDCDCFIDKDFELVLQQMCCGETGDVRMVYRDGNDELVKEIKCRVELKEVTEEQLISEWGWERLYDAALYHKEKGVDLVKEKRLPDAFRRFHKALKMLIAIEPFDPETIEEDKVQELIDLKVKLYNNLAHCQLQYNEYAAALELCNRALSFHPDSVKALYRRSVAYSHLQMYEEAWSDIQRALLLDPNDKAAQQRASELKPRIEKMNTEYSSVIKNMFR